MITIHERNAVDFSNIGLGTLLPISCNVREELNGLYELSMEHPYDDYSKWRNIENDNIIYADTPKGKQAFRIYKIVPSMESISVHARHIFYDLIDNFVEFLSVSGTASSFMANLKSSLLYASPFEFSTNISATKTISITDSNPIQCLLDSGVESFIESFGGELLRDNFNVAMNYSIGTDRGVQIRYSKNLIGLEVDEDISEVATRIFGIGDGGLKLPERYIDSTRINEYAVPKVYKFEDTSAKTVAQLRASVNNLLTQGIDIPLINIKADFQLLAKTAEYKDYSILETVYLGDTVSVINPRMNFNKKAKVISYEWDSLLNKYNSVELGDFVADLTSGLSLTEKKVNTQTNLIYGELANHNLSEDAHPYIQDLLGENKAIISGQIGTEILPTAPSKIGFNEFWTTQGIVYDAPTRRFTVSQKGTYRITLNPFKVTGANAIRVLIGINNDAPIQSTHKGHAYSDSAGYDTLSLNSVVSLEAGDYVVFYLMQGALYNNSSDKFTQFSIERIR